MRNSFATKAASFATVAAIVMPGFASALSAEELQAQIQSLLGQLHVLQEQLREQVSSTTPPQWKAGEGMGAMMTDDRSHSEVPRGICVAIERTLSRGMTGEDVRQLQQKLIEEGDLQDRTAATGFFGPLTEAAVHRMQVRLGLVASSTPAGDSVVGPLTRARLRSACEKMLSNASSTASVAGMIHDAVGQFFGSSSTPGRMAGMVYPQMMQVDQQQVPSDRNSVGGMISAVTADTVSVKDRSGVVRTVTITSTTVIRVYDDSAHKMRQGGMSDLLVGDTILAHGLGNIDGSLNAVLIQKGIPMTGSSGAMMQGFVRGGDSY